MKRTILQHIEEFPEPWRSQALENYDPDYWGHKNYYGSAQSALRSSFDKYTSKEGGLYWLDFASTLSEEIPEPERYECEVWVARDGDSDLKISTQSHIYQKRVAIEGTIFGITKI